MNSTQHVEPEIEPNPVVVDHDQRSVVDGQSRRESIWRVVGGSIAAGSLGAGPPPSKYQVRGPFRVIGRGLLPLVREHVANK
jgi:hypothetical protein